MNAAEKNNLQPNHLTILLIEDNPGDARLVREALSHSLSSMTFSLHVVQTLGDGIKQLAVAPVDIILLDLNLPDSFGHETFTKLFQQYSSIPIIVLSSSGTEDLAVKTVIEGAQDYLFKDTLDNFSLVVRTIRNAYSRFEIRTQLLQAESRLRTVLESTSDGIVVTDLQGRIRFANSAAEEFLGRDKGTLEGTMFPFPLSLEGETEVTVPKNDASSVTLALKTNYTFWDEGPAYCISLRDITERKQIVDALVEARREAERTARAKSDFLANMSHEIRTPMNGVIGTTSLLLDTKLDSEQREYVETIRSSGELLLNIINDILDLSKIEAGKLELETSAFTLDNVLSETIDLFSEPVRQKNLLLTCSVAKDVATELRGDPWRLRQVLSNLVGNAIKFTSQGEVAITVTKQGASGTGQTLLFEVHDSGIGVSEEGLAKLFQPFSQTDTSMTRKFGGTGLGLAICKRIVELMGGQIGATSKPGVGSNFWISVPFEEATGDRSASAPRVLPQSVLLLTANPFLRARFPSLLQPFSINVLAAQTLTSFSSEQLSHIAAVFLDCDLAEPNLSAFFAHPVAQTARSIWIQTGLKGPSQTQKEGHRVLKNPFQPRDLLKALLDAEDSARPRTHIADQDRGEVVTIEPGSRGLVLVVEDNTVNQKIVLRMLAKLGYRADTAANGVEAVTAARRIHYDAILMDCQMPEMDGFEATARIRKGERAFSQNTPIIAMTAHALQGDRERCLGAGMNDYVAKPIKLEALSTVMEKWISDDINTKDTSTMQSATNTTASSGLDTEMLRAWRELTDHGESDFLTEVIDIFLDNTPPLISQIRAATHEKDSTSLRQLAHKLKGSSSNLGATGMAQLCATLEEKGLRGNLEDSDGLVDKLENEFSCVRTALEKDWRVHA